jgi:CheY-like chemotaxis protein
MKVSLKRNLIIGFGISLLLLIVSSAASLTSIHNLFASAGWVDHTHLVVENLEKTMAQVQNAESGQMTVIPAMDGREALQLLKSSPVDVVLMDMMMPEMDGYESIKAIRQERRYKKLPVIAVTAKTMAGDREKCIAAGASDYISKPVDMDQLVSLLRIWLYEKGY